MFVSSVCRMNVVIHSEISAQTMILERLLDKTLGDFDFGRVVHRK